MTDAAPPIGHNSGVPDPEIAAEAMRRTLAPWDERRLEFEKKAKLANVDCADAAKLAIDFIRMARALRDKAGDLRAEVRKPYEDAANAAGGVAGQFIDSVEASIRQMQSALTAYNEERAAKAKAAADLQAQVEQELAQRAAERDGLAAPQIPTLRRRKAAPIRTDLGGRMVEHDRWRVEVVDPTLVPAFILKSPRVVEAIRIVARDFLKNGTEVPGCEKVDFTATVIS